MTALHRKRTVTRDLKFLRLDRMPRRRPVEMCTARVATRGTGCVGSAACSSFSASRRIVSTWAASRSRVPRYTTTANQKSTAAKKEGAVERTSWPVLLHVEQIGSQPSHFDFLRVFRVDDPHRNGHQPRTFSYSGYRHGGNSYHVSS